MVERLTNLSDDALLAALGQRLARARLDRNLTQRQLAREAGVSLRTLSRFEAGESIQLVNLLRLLRALDLTSGLQQLLPDATPSPISQLKQRRPRQRATGSRGTNETSDWEWGEDDA